MSSPYKTFAIKTFGCKVNFADSSMITQGLVEYGLSCVDIKEIADIYIINTCSVTENADKKANQFIKSLNMKSPLSKIIITGCYAQLNSEKISQQEGVDLVIGMEDKLNIEKYLFKNLGRNIVRKNIDETSEFNISYSLSERTRSFIKIQDGCDYSCTYCTIPNARGKSRSGTIDNILNKINFILNSGIKEIVLSGINVGDFGSNDEDLYMLLLELEKLNKLHRYRISSIEPNLLNNNIINVFSKSKKALPHFHIPLQSGSNKILKAMKRRYSTIDYYKLIKKINKKIPNVCIGVDVIVGFPIETLNDFMETYNFIEGLDITYLHVFSYSKRFNTEASNIESIVSNKEIIHRRKMLQKLSNDKFKYYINKNIGSKSKVLFEKKENEFYEGLTENYIRVNVKSEKELKNKIKNVKIVRNDKFVLGELI